MTTPRHYNETDLDQFLDQAEECKNRWIERGYHEGDLLQDPYYLCAQALRQVRAERDEARTASKRLRNTLKVIGMQSASDVRLRDSALAATEPKEKP